jgi:hypothetical protein
MKRSMKSGEALLNDEKCRVCFHDYDNCNCNRCGFTFSNVIVCQHSLFQSLRAVGGLMKNEDETVKLNEKTVGCVHVTNSRN